MCQTRKIFTKNTKSSARYVRFFPAEMLVLEMKSPAETANRNAKEENRIKTFNVPGYNFAYATRVARLAKRGFFYTLYNSVVQCAFCRVVLSNVAHLTMDEDVVAVHYKESNKCSFIWRPSNVGNIERQRAVVASTPTPNKSLQCKVCFENEINVIYECGHFIQCSQCASKMDSCPYCRAPFIHERRLYLP
ncbi:unnamed protein product [Medioppia subpectinata]|uniref:RING-type domain-containing protein n=1 Tax=Medioppia subpectinata TaxID=1979941 RepID=A0A7R9KBA7_9ACAR|nr:unnamed protein product [Medioppia subpectinata]CAG2100300.1 unnamed protein product [Medioppia subpectinata]